METGRILYCYYWYGRDCFCWRDGCSVLVVSFVILARRALVREGGVFQRGETGAGVRTGVVCMGGWWSGQRRKGACLRKFTANSAHTRRAGDRNYLPPIASLENIILYALFVVGADVGIYRSPCADTVFVLLEGF